MTFWHTWNIKTSNIYTYYTIVYKPYGFCERQILISSIASGPFQALSAVWIKKLKNWRRKNWIMLRSFQDPFCKGKGKPLASLVLYCLKSIDPLTSLAKCSCQSIWQLLPIANVRCLFLHQKIHSVWSIDLLDTIKCKWSLNSHVKSTS